jgi:hypothetical protein
MLHPVDMPDLSSSSTIADALTQWKDNSSYRRNSSAAQAELFREACDWLITLRPTRARHGSQTFEFSVAELQQQKASAEQFIAANATAGTTASSRRRNVLHASFSPTFRG